MSRFAALFLKDTPPDDAADRSAEKGPAPGGYTILFVDDEQSVLKSMGRIFRKENYRLLFAESAEEALSLMDGQPVQVIVSDHRMPGMTGADLLREVKRQHPGTIRIMLTGHADVNAVMGAVNEGAVYKFITKPWNDDDLRLTVSLALEQYDLIHENRELKKTNLKKDREIKKLTRFVNTHKSQLGKLLLKRGLLSEAEMERARSLQAVNNKILTDILIREKLVDEGDIHRIIQDELQIDFVFPEEFAVPSELAALIPADVCRQNMLVPLKKVDRRLIVAMADPTDFAKVDDLSFIAGLPVQPVLSSIEAIRQKIDATYSGLDTLESAMSEVEMTDPTEIIEIILDEDDDADIDELINAKAQPPAIRIVNAILSDALRHNASDVHIEPKTQYVMVRYRVDDLLQDKIHIPLSMHLPIVSRIKIMSELDIAERRRPQDGRVTVKTSTRLVDMRISTLPTINGEKVVLRVLDKNAAIRDVEALGMSGGDIRKVVRFMQHPQGILLTTGPTGSGKTSTLYSLLHKSAKITKNFTTIEDPVEFQMNMAEQVNVREKIGLNFSNVLRAILRQDPNVIMLGEIRDYETAEVAFHAALTGHLVLSTLHTNNSVAAITRLRDLGLKSYVISDALLGIIAQRLVRRICPDCIRDDRPSQNLRKSICLPDAVDAARGGGGCRHCNQTGYRGRCGVYEIFQIDNEIRDMIHQEGSEKEMLATAKLAGMTTLLDDAHAKIGRGITTCEEVLRVFGPQNGVELRCGGCGSIMEQRNRYCPFCGNPLIRICLHCGKLLNGDWTHCPACGRAKEDRIDGHRTCGPKEACRGHSESNGEGALLGFR